MDDVSRLMARLDDGLRETPWRNPDYGSDAMLAVADWAKEAADQIATISKGEHAECLRAMETGLRNRAARASRLSGVFAERLAVTLTAMEADTAARQRGA